MLPADPLAGKPKPFMPPRLKVGCMGVGIRPFALDGSAPKSEAFSMAGRIKALVPNGDCGWLRTSKSSSSMSMSMSLDCDDCTGPPYAVDVGVSSSQSDCVGVMASISEGRRGGVSEGRSGRFCCIGL